MKSLLKKALIVWVALPLAVWAAGTQTRFDLARLPLWFEAGQDGAAHGQFTAHGRDSLITLSADRAEFALGRPGGPTATARMQFVGADEAAAICGGAEMPARINYLSGNDPAKWQSGLAAFGQVRVTGLYPGVNVVYYGNQQRLEYDFDLAPGARPETVNIRFAGAQKVLVNSQGELVVQLAGRNIIQHQPVAYQTNGGARQPVAVGYKMVDAQTVAFAVGHYDSHLPLVIDPVLSYSTFFGGNNNDVAWAVAFATNDDSVYIAGQTLSSTISSTVPFATPGSFQTNFQGGSAGEAFVAKFRDLSQPAQLNNLATNLIYCTYLGGNSEDTAKALAVDATGHAFLAGATISPNFPVKNAVVYQSFNGSNISGKVDPNLHQYPSDGFVTELETNGASLIYSTYLGGEGYDAILGLALDSSDNAYLTGYTYSTNFPVTNHSRFASVYNFYLGCNAFVSEVAAGGKTLNYSSYLGGTNVDVGYAIACNNQYVAVAGLTCSSNFPTLNAIKQVQLIYSNSIVVATNIYDGTLLNGSTNNINNNLHIASFISDAFVTVYPVSGATLAAPLYSTLLGGTNVDVAYGIAIDPAGNVDVVGGTVSMNFPYSINPGQLMLPSFVLTNTSGFFVTNCFLTQLQYTNSRPTIAYSQVFGGTGNDVAQGVALDPTGNLFVVGYTTSITNVLANPANLLGALSETNSGTVNVFVDAFQAGFSNVLYAADLGSSTQDAGFGIAVDPNDGVYIVGQTLAAANSTVGFPVFNAWEPVAPDNNNGFLAKILPQVSPLPVLSIRQPGTNLLVSWTASPLAQLNTNSFYLQVNSNLVMDVVVTNFIYNTNMPPFSTNMTVMTNLAPSTSWSTVTQKPMVTNIFIGGFTNQIYQYPFIPTNSMRYFRLRSFTY